MRKILVIVLALLLSSLPVMASAVTLTMGSWRADDVTQMNALLNVYKEETGVEILFQPINPPEYNANIRLQLENGSGPDLLYSRSYATGRELYDSGFVADLSDVEGLMQNFTDQSRDPWVASDGKPFAVPFGAVSHAMYYNKDIFAQNNLTVPTTWDEFLAVCEALKTAGITPLANGVADEWDILECFFLGMLPNYVGGAEERIKYQNGEKKLNDEAFVAAYSDFAMVAPYLDENFAAITYNDSQVMFGSGRAAMFMDGSWTCGTYGDTGFEWGVFAIPARNAEDTAVCFHLDVALAANAASPNLEEAKKFLDWVASENGANAAGKYMPAGIFPMIELPVTIDDAHAAEIYALNAGKATDTRFIWPAMTELYVPMNMELIKLLKGETTPQEAADAIQALYEAQ